MQNTTAVKSRRIFRAGSLASPCESQLPLSFLSKGKSAIIAKVRGKEEIHHHLKNLGFVEGSHVKVISENVEVVSLSR